MCKVDEFVEQVRSRIGPRQHYCYIPVATLTQALKIIEAQREALERLARLGNEPAYGNSTGNEIARAALDMEV
jgi:hypothetical protein